MESTSLDSNRHEPSGSVVPPSRPVRRSRIAARDHLIAWSLQQRVTFRAYKIAPEGGFKSLKAKKAASAVTSAVSKQDVQKRERRKETGRSRQREVMSGTQMGPKGDGLTSALPVRSATGRSTSAPSRSQKEQVPVSTEARPTGPKPDSRSASKQDRTAGSNIKKKKTSSESIGVNSSMSRPQKPKRSPLLERLIRRVKKKRDLALLQRTERTVSVAEKGMKKSDWEDSETVISFVLCPTDEPKRQTEAGDPSFMGKLTRAKLSAPPEATIFHLKRFLVSKLPFDGSLKDIEIACRGLVLADNKSLYTVKNLLWPKNHHMDPVLRYRKISPHRSVPQEQQIVQKKNISLEEVYRSGPLGYSNPSNRQLLQPIPVSQLKLDRKPKKTEVTVVEPPNHCENKGRPGPSWTPNNKR